MIPINKGSEPQLLGQYRASPGAVYDGGPTQNDLTFTQVKMKIREQLVSEQGYLCAYCMGRIRPNDADMKIEHWTPQSRDPSKQLIFINMLGCCTGRLQNGGRFEEHCDSAKKNTPIEFNPSNRAHHARLGIRYKPNGEISADHTTFDTQVNSVLNLNATRLVENRKMTWNALMVELSKNPGTASRATVQGLRTRWENRSGNGELHPYCGVAIFYLNKVLARLPR